MSRTFSRRSCTLSTCEFVEQRRAARCARKSQRRRTLGAVAAIAERAVFATDFSLGARDTDPPSPRPVARAVAVLALVVLVALTAHTLRADEWPDEVPAELAHGLLNSAAALPLWCDDCAHQDSAYGMNGLVGFVQLGTYEGGLYMYSGEENRYILVNTLASLVAARPERLEKFTNVLARALTLSQQFQRRPTTVRRLESYELPSAADYETWLDQLANDPLRLWLLIGLIVLVLLGVIGLVLTGPPQPHQYEADDDDDDDYVYTAPAPVAPVAIALPAPAPVLAVPVAPAAAAAWGRSAAPVLSPKEELDLLKAEEIRRIREELAAITANADRRRW